MGKRKQDQDKAVTLAGKMDVDDSSGDEDFDVLDVEFEWFDPKADVDFHGIKTLLQQLFDIDAQLFDLSALTDLILAQPLLGSTVKVEGQETDAYAFLSVVNLQEHKNKACVASLIGYLHSKAGSQQQLQPLVELLSRPEIPPIGLILTERLINVPSEVVPPMYTMLREEIEWAVEEKEPYSFTHYLILSKTYTEVASKLDTEDNQPKKKSKTTGGGGGGGGGAFETMYFHPEDEVLQEHAMCYGGFDYTSKQDDGFSDSKRAFQEMGIKPQSHAILIEAAKFEQAVNNVADYLKPPS